MGVAAHPDIGNIAGLLREDARICSGDVRVCAGNKAYFAVQIIAESQFFGCCFGVNID